MKPTVGRIVHYFPAEWDIDAIHYNSPEVLPAIIVRVWNDDCVNLKVITDGPEEIWKTSVLHSDTHEKGSWSWPTKA